MTNKPKMNNTILPVCKCGVAYDFLVEQTRFVVRKMDETDALTKEKTTHIVGQLIITLKCGSCGVLHPIYINRLDDTQNYAAMTIK